MSFAKAIQEVQALERRVEELTRAGRAKDLEISRLQQASEVQHSADELRGVLEALEKEPVASKRLSDVLVQFVDAHQCLATGMNVLKSFGSSSHQQLVQAVVARLEKSSSVDEPVITAELLKLSRGLLMESRANCPQLCDNVVSTVISRISAKHSPGVREAAARCAHTILFDNTELRASLVANEQTIDGLNLALEGMASLIRDSGLSSNAECARLFVTSKALFVGDHSEGDSIIARMLLRTGFISATIERMSNAFLEAVDIKEHKLLANNGPVVSTTQEGIARGSVLLDGFRFIYVVAIFADKDMLAALLHNDGKPTLSGEQLEKCDLSDRTLGMGDRYVFLQTHAALVSTSSSSSEKDIKNLDMIKVSVCSLLMFADRALGFVAYLFRRGVGPALFDLLDRETTRAKMPGHGEHDLLSIIIAMKTLIDHSDDFKEQFQDLFFARLLPDLDPSEFPTQEEYNTAREKRHFAGRSIPDTPFGKMVALLTSFHDHVKRYVGEMLYSLCDSDPNKMNVLVGFGHAAHILAVKGGMFAGQE